MAWQNFINRLWSKDPTLWSTDKSIQLKIANRLGWLDLVTEPKVSGTLGMWNHLGAINQFVEEIKKRNYTTAVLLGMGGSSLSPWVLSKVFPPQKKRGLRLLVLDTSSGAQIATLEKELNLRQTLFIVSSKSGKTIEPLSLFEYFYHQLSKQSAKPGNHFIAITDPGTNLEMLAREKGFLKSWLNPPDIGGRYSALSFFGLIPAALLGINLGKLLQRAEEMAEKCKKSSLSDNPGLKLGKFMADNLKSGRDKLTILLDPQLQAFGLWLEQLIAESTGKSGNGIVPIVGEKFNRTAYAQDRFFVYLGFSTSTPSADLESLRKSGYPLETLLLWDKYCLGSEFFRWEMATAVAGSLIGINPFDEPNVAESKKNTSEILEEYKLTGRLPEPKPIIAEAGAKVYLSEVLKPILDDQASASIPELMSRFFSLIKPPSYLSFLAYWPENQRIKRLFCNWQAKLSSHLSVATTVGFGPRYLHSTGQEHKGGENLGYFIIITGRQEEDRQIPGVGYSFNQLQMAQALGDFQALSEKGRRVIRLDLDANKYITLSKFLSSALALAKEKMKVA